MLKIPATASAPKLPLMRHRSCAYTSRPAPSPPPPCRPWHYILRAEPNPMHGSPLKGWVLRVMLGSSCHTATRVALKGEISELPARTSHPPSGTIAVGPCRVGYGAGGQAVWAGRAGGELGGRPQLMRAPWHDYCCAVLRCG